MKTENVITTDKKRNYYAVFMIINAAFFFLMHLTFVGFTNDETYFLVYKENFSSLFDIIVDRYKTDSSRVISETFLFYLLGKPFILWQILDTLMCVLIFHSLSVILVNDKYSKKNAVVFMLFASYPYMHVGSAGWICTSLNYLWPLATVLYAFSGMYRMIRGEKIRAWQYVLYILSMIFTANTEMSSTYMFLAFAGAIIISMITKSAKKDATRYEIIGCVIGILGIIFAFTAPGNGQRNDFEAANWMPEFPNLSIVEKLRLCSVFVFEHFVAIPDIIFIIFAVVIAIIGLKNRKKLWEKIVILTPISITGIYTIGYGIKYIADILKRYNAGGGIKINYDFTTPSIYPSGKDALLQYVEFISLYIYIIAAVIAVTLIVKDMARRLSVIIALGAGFAVRMALMLSPTMFSSWHRTLIFMYFGYIYAIMMILNERDNNISGGKPAKWTNRIIYGILVVGIIVNLVLTVGLQIRKG